MDNQTAVPGDVGRSSSEDDCDANSWALQMIDGALIGLSASSMILRT